MILVMGVGVVAWAAYELVLDSLQTARYGRAMAYCALIALLASAALTII